MEASGGGAMVEEMADQVGAEEGSFFFKGTISEAIARAQASDLVLIVFVAGDDEESVSMELTTFRDSAVVDEVKKESLMLRLQEGSTDAAYFQAIFPVRRVPMITFLGFKGTLLGQLEGYQDAEKFLTALRNVQLQRVAAKAMVALLSTANLAAANGGASVAPPPAAAPTPEPPTSAAPPLAAPPPEPPTSAAHAGISTREDVPAQPSSSAVVPEGARRPQPVAVAPVDGRASGGINAAAAAGTNSSSKSTASSSEAVPKKKAAPLRREPFAGAKPAVKARTGPFQVQVRLTNGESIQGTFESYQLLRDVKNFVDLQRTDGNIKFRLAVPFPRKLFSEEDMGKTLSKLDIGPRSALILIGSDNPTGNPSHSRAQASSETDSSRQTEASPAAGSYVGKFLSFLSPYVYGRSVAPQHPPSSHSSLREGAQPPMSNASRPEAPFTMPSEAAGAATEEGGPAAATSTAQGGRLSQRRGSGSNVHTLRGGGGADDEGPAPGNMYWNGNSTQFGGNDEAKED